MSFVARLRGFVTAETDANVLFECRRCGTSLRSDDESCPSCDSTEIARFELG